MDSFCINKETIDFSFKTNFDSTEIELNDKIIIPFESDVTLREVCFRLIKKNSLPEKIFPELYEKLNKIIEDYVDDYEIKYAEKILTNREILSNHVQTMLNDHQLLNDSSSAETKSNASKESTLVDDNFYQMYHEIIHSGKLTTQLIQLELHNSEVIKSLLEDKKKALDLVAEDEEEKLQNIEQIISNDEDFQKTISKNSLIDEEKAWRAKIDSVRKQQKSEFRKWIKNIHEDYIQHKNAPVNNPFDNDALNRSMMEDFVEFMPEDEILFEESYTINLGSQLKTTHNLRLISVDILKFCSTICTPHRIQTAMSLYSNSLSAIVLLVDKEILSHNEICEEFHKLCLSSSENHFPDFKVQLNEIHSTASEKRSTKIRGGRTKLNAGDVFVTRHSNLSEAHVVFHLVTDDSLKHQEINSRHPVILGIRNILKMAYLYDIANISIPLLLLHHMLEDCTIQWCMKRAELVLKCVKGFMIEMSSLLSLAENENKTIQFVVPKDISHDLFNSLSSIFPNVFRLSNTLILTTNS